MLAAISGFAAEAVDISGICYYLNADNNTAEVTQKRPRYSGDVVIPSLVTYDGKQYTVTSIGRSAFNYCQELTSLVLPNTIKEIGDGAINYCTLLTSIAIPNSVEKIGAGVFSGDTSLEKIELQSDNRNFKCEDYMLLTYDGKNLLQVLPKKEGVFEVPSTITTIASCALQGCGKITSVILPSSLLKIEEGAFHNLSISEISIPQNVSIIEEGAFELCYGLKNILVEKGNPNFVSEGGLLMDAAKNTIIATVVQDSYEFPSTVTRIGKYCFSGLKTTKVVIPNSVKVIGEDSYFSCQKLENVVIGESVELIESSFGGCPKIVSVNILATTPPNTKTLFLYSQKNNITLTVPKGCLDTYRASNRWNYFANIVEAEENDNNVWIDDQLNGIHYALDYNTQTAKVVRYSYANWENEPYTGDIVIPETVKKNGQEYIVTEIDDSAFEYCTITSVSLPSTIEKIGINPFNLCQELSSFTIDPNNKNFVFENKQLMTSDKKHLIAIIGAWKQQCGVEIFKTVETIGSYAATVCRGMTSLSLPISLKEVGKNAFYNCSGLTSVIIPKSVERIASGAFSGCISLKELTVETDNKNFKYRDGMLLTTDETRLLTVLTNVRTFKIPDTVTAIDSSFCSNNVNVTSAVIPDNVTYLGHGAFSGCENLETVTLGSAIENMSYPFLACTKIKSIYNRSKTPYIFELDQYFEWDFIFGNGDPGNECYSNCTLYVPIGTKEVYEKAKYWRDFANIKEFDPTGISSATKADNNEIKTIYGLDGTRTRTMKRGLNIIKMQDGSVKKVIVK